MPLHNCESLRWLTRRAQTLDILYNLGMELMRNKAGKAFWSQPTLYEAHRNAREQAGLPLHAPFASFGEWELTQILVESGSLSGLRTGLLRSDMFTRCRAAAPGDYASFSINRTFQETIDSVPGPSTPWKLIEITVTGNLRDAKGEVMKRWSIAGPVFLSRS
ncbi:hypothetical protein OH76DRAFT_1487957 [Lentinus brumalis]|uniref:Uncharacterized protein n=1 Tax=Lentinus brumalis TaxID=2498619 RepID=A0A371CSY3_9APHY|nr:hypothetical protein OH76DRAFT_1487957 [Polyporus brumalis]